MLMTTPVCAEAVLKEREDLQMQYPQGGDIGYLLCAVEDGGWVPEARLSLPTGCLDRRSQCSSLVQA